MRFIIKEYINKVTISDIINFGKKNDINIEKGEAKILIYYLKNNWEDLLYGNPLPIIHKIESLFETEKSQRIIDLFYLYKEKYKTYL